VVILYLINVFFFCVIFFWQCCRAKR